MDTPAVGARWSSTSRPHTNEGTQVRARIGGTLTTLPDPTPQPGRVLVRVNVSARMAVHCARSADARRLGKHVVARLRQIPEILRYDGPGVLASKALHMFRRETLASGTNCASFAATVLRDLSEEQPPVSGRVAGFVLTHEASTECVVARREFVLPLQDAVTDVLGALALPGSMAAYAAAQVRDLAHGHVGISGDGPLAHVAASLLISSGIAVTTLPHYTGLDTKALSCIGGIPPQPLALPDCPGAWIETDSTAPERPFRARKVVGIQVNVHKYWFSSN